MNEQNILSGQQESRPNSSISLDWTKTSGLRLRIILSYVWVTAVLVLILEILAMLGLAYMLFSVVVPFTYTLAARQSAEQYALVASLQAKAVLNPRSTFMEGQPGTLVLTGKTPSLNDFHMPYISVRASGTSLLAFALLIAPDGHILASSYPQRYPLNTPVSLLLPNRLPSISGAMMGTRDSGQAMSSAGASAYAVEPVWSRGLHPIGAIYVQIKVPSVQSIFTLSPPLLRLLGISGLIMLLILVPIGSFFGMLTMRGLLQRIRMLVATTARFADGDYGQRVHVGRHDEIGQLEYHFNRMSHQLAESIRRQQTLTEQTTRLAERTRMSRDLHDSIKQQVFALATQIGAALALLDHEREETRTHLVVANELAYQVRQELTALIQELRPAVRVGKEFSQALQDFLERWSRQNGIVIDMQLQDIPPLSTPIEEELLLVVEEALSNVARHSQASHVQVMLAQKQEQIVLTISDDGSGFDRTTISTQNLGLQSMQERMEGIGGMLQIQSGVGQGTQIVASLHSPSSQ